MRRRAARYSALLVGSRHRRLLMFALTEAKALIIRHRDAVLAFARALMIHKALNAVIIHEIVASAPERTRRDDCAVVEQNATAFAVHELEAVDRA
jgi:hypothetical protein